jgi:hypothetical protein
MGLKLAHIADITDVVAFAVLVLIDAVELAASQQLDVADSLKNRDAICTPAADVIDLAREGVGSERLHRTDHIVAMDIVTNLFAFVAVDVVSLPIHGYLDQIGEKSM